MSDVLPTVPLVAYFEPNRIDGFPVVKIEARDPQTGHVETTRLLLAHTEYAEALVKAINVAGLEEAMRLDRETARVRSVASRYRTATPPVEAV